MPNFTETAKEMLQRLGILDLADESIIEYVATKLELMYQIGGRDELIKLKDRI